LKSEVFQTAYRFFYTTNLTIHGAGLLKFVFYLKDFDKWNDLLLPLKERNYVLKDGL